jgi:DNA-directed RNA polymerase subunit RPC12/RpoP
MEAHPNRTEKTTNCSSCSAEIKYSVAESGEAAASGGEEVRCPSCGRPVQIEGQDPRLEEFGPGLGQHGA